MEFPEYDKNEPKYKYFSRLNKYLQFEQNKKRVDILNFMNEWLYGVNYEKSQIKLQNLLDFKDYKYADLPKNSESKKILIKHFNRLNELFDLNLEYDEELFTTYNVIYFIKLMVETIGFKLKKRIDIQKNKEGSDINIKIYKIACK
jgi:hypothetical protein